MNKYEKLFKEITGYNFESYYNENKPSLTWYIARYYTKDLDRAEDFANQAFMQSLEKIETYNKDKSMFKTWLTKIAINLAIKEWKDNHKYNFISLERDNDEAPSILNILKYDEGSENEYEHENKKKCEIIYDVIENLPDKYKKVMVMRELNHMAYKDIADTIKKEIPLDLSNILHKLDNPEDFFSLYIENKGDNKLKIDLISENEDNSYEVILLPNENITISRDDISWERGNGDNFNIDCHGTKCDGVYITTTNLSTIKSQIKKGRELIVKKVKKKFQNINENGLSNFYD